MVVLVIESCQYDREEIECVVRQYLLLMEAEWHPMDRMLQRLKGNW